MRLLFVITGIGLGHTIREAAIMQEILRQKPNTKIMVAGFKNSYTYFRNKLPCIEIHGHKFPESDFEVSRLKSLLINLPYPIWDYKDKKKLIKTIKEFNPDKIIVDVQPVGIKAAIACKKPAIAIYNLDLEEWHNFNSKLSFLNRMESKLMFHYIKQSYDKADKVIIPTMKKSVKKSRYCFVSPILRKMPSELLPEKTLMKKLNLKSPPIVIMLGGSKFGFSIEGKIIEVAQYFKEEFIIFGYKDIKKGNVTSFKFNENFL